ncbi:MAG: LysM peptidoglycan-binding domain-containing protein [Deltaproteobacteria bacterium]|nr:LysM peptidoglycan-binding domain-containing protein [Deltaproteobacteria bacterium]
MSHIWLSRLLLLLSLLIWSGCATSKGTSEKQKPIDEQMIGAEGDPSEMDVFVSETTEGQNTGGKSSFAPNQDSGGPISSESVIQAVGETTPPSHSAPSAMSNQELLDSSLEFYQASSDFWERGDLDNAIAALDKAYFLILQMNADEDPVILQQKEDLRITISRRIVEVYASRFTVANGDHKEVPLLMNAHVEKELALFKGRERDFFLASYRRSGKYRPFIVNALREAGLPEELSWLPLIESGFKTNAYSKARALGMWQFVKSTGYKFGLKGTQYIDERMDPEKSTLAAIAYLKELHSIFGDWMTALAAYNYGEGRVLNRIKSQRIDYLDNFWDFYESLPSETARYVPRFLAVLNILDDPEAHGFTLPEVDEPIETEKVDIQKQVQLETVARRLDIDYGLLKDLNPELRQQLTPSEPYSLRVPKGKGEVLLAKLDEIPVYRPAYRSHTVKRGESLSVIAERYGSSVRAIMTANNLHNKHYLRINQKLKIPLSKAAIASLDLSQDQASQIKGEIIEYTVRKGDSLWLIARRYQTTTKMIQSLNQLDSTLLSIGQVLKIPTSQTTASVMGDTQTYMVRKGDSPYLIAKRHNMDLSIFLALNGLSPRSTIFPGQILKTKSK